MGGNLVELSDAASVDRAAQALFGTAFRSRPAVSHSGSVWKEPGSGILTTIQINAHSPKSDLDWLALHIGRARADAIVITGKILRDEPDLRYELTADPRWGNALARWRERQWGLFETPWLLVLTESADFDFQHPALHGWPKPLIFTSDATATRKLSGAPFPVVADEAPDIRRAIRHLQVSRECQSVSIEAGPSTAVTLYDPPVLVNELLLSVYLGKSLDEEAAGRPLIELPQLRGRFRSETSATHRSGGEPWSFHRFKR